ncbi:MAG: M55 family metallopeptidase [Anaerolineales bacterium]
MTDEVNAAISRATEAGADEFFVADGHEDGTNILLEEQSPRQVELQGRLTLVNDERD